MTLPWRPKEQHWSCKLLIAEWWGEGRHTSKSRRHCFELTLNRNSEENARLMPTRAMTRYQEAQEEELRGDAAVQVQRVFRGQRNRRMVSFAPGDPVRCDGFARNRRADAEHTCWSADGRNPAGCAQKRSGILFMYAACQFQPFLPCLSSWTLTSTRCLCSQGPVRGPALQAEK